MIYKNDNLQSIVKSIIKLSEQVDNKNRSTRIYSVFMDLGMMIGNEMLRPMMTKEQNNISKER